MDIIIDWILTGVNNIMTGVVLVGTVVMLGTVQILSSALSDQQAVRLDMQEYTEYNQYDFTHVYAQDVSTAILQYRGFPTVKVSCDGTTKTWSEAFKATPYTAVEVNNAVRQDVIYDADIERNGNGEVIAVWFRQCDNGMVCGGR